MADQWEQAAKEFNAGRGTLVPTASAPKSGNDEWKIWQQQGTAPTNSVGLWDYAKETVSNIPSSAAKFVGNAAQAAMHPVDTLTGIGKVITGAEQRGLEAIGFPKPPEEKATGKSVTPEFDAAKKGMKERYGSLDAIKNTVRTDPVGAAADASAVLGGVSGAARGVGAVAPRVASAANTVADVSRLASDAVNPLTLPLKAGGAAAKGIAKPLVKQALGLKGKTERYGATPATAALEETSGITPNAVRESATQRLAALNDELKALARASGDQADLTAARQVVAREIAEVERANGSTADLLPMQKQLNEAQPGFGGAITPSGDVAAKQDPLQFLAMKRQFGDDFTKFDAAVPLKDSTRQVGNKAYRELSTEFNRAVPGAQPINQRMQSLVPVKEGAQRAEEGAGAVQRAIDRSTRPTGGLAAVLMGLHEKGIFGAGAVMAAQELLSSPTAKMGAARGLYGTGKAAGSAAARRGMMAAGEAGKIDRDDSKLPRYAKGGIAGRHGPEKIIVGDGGEPEAIIPLSKLPPKLSTPGSKQERHLINSLKYRAMEGLRPPRLSTPRRA